MILNNKVAEQIENNTFLSIVNFFLHCFYYNVHFFKKSIKHFFVFKVSVPIVSNDKCKSMFLRAGRHEVIPDIFMCAGYDHGGRDSCQVRLLVFISCFYKYIFK